MRYLVGSGSGQDAIPDTSAHAAAWLRLRPSHAGHDTRALQAWLGHKNIQHTVRYTELAPDRFKNFWR
jgi:site-specific recombinase XerD